MSNAFRRFEMLLPLRFNNGQPIPDEVVADALLELRERCGAVSCESQTTQGTWVHEGHVYRDDLVRVYVDVPDLPESRSFFATFKEKLKQRFQQVDIWLTTYPIEVL
jgi:hypothetical protein